MSIELRPYQEAAIAALWDYWRGGGGNPLLELATGTGKSLIIGELVRRLMARRARRILVLTHVKELIEQDVAAIKAVWPEAPVGIVSAGLGRREIDAPIGVAGIQSIHRSPEVLGSRNLVIIDEAHLVPADGDGMYRTTVDALRDLYPKMRVCGLTATPYRLDSGRLDEGDGRLFDRIVYSYGIAEAIDDGWLAPLTARRTRAEIDVQGVARRGGEFVAAELEAAADAADVVSAAADEIVARGAARRSWLCFCAGINHARHVRDALRERGVTAEIVTGDTPAGERAEIFAAFCAGRIRALTGMNVFTTGFNAPGVDLIAMLRPTLSPGLYVQMLGRGTRLADGKADCEVLDFAGNVRRHGTVDAVTGDRGKGGGKKAHDKDDGSDGVPVRCCPECGTYAPVAATECQACGHVWTRPRAPKHDVRAEEIPVLSREVAWIAVRGWTATIHRKPDRQPSLRIDFDTGTASYADWLMIEHAGTAGAIARRKWRSLGGKEPPPRTVTEAWARLGELTATPEIAVARKGQFWNVTQCRQREVAAA